MPEAASMPTSAPSSGAVEKMPPRMLRVEFNGRPYDWFDLNDMSDVVRSTDFAETLRENIAHYFNIPIDCQVAFDENGMVSTSVDLCRALQSVRPRLRIYDVREMQSDFREQIAGKLNAIDKELERSRKNLEQVDRLSNGRVMTAAEARTPSPRGASSFQQPAAGPYGSYVAPGFPGVGTGPRVQAVQDWHPGAPPPNGAVPGLPNGMPVVPGMPGLPPGAPRPPAMPAQPAIPGPPNGFPGAPGMPNGNMPAPGPPGMPGMFAPMHLPTIGQGLYGSPMPQRGGMQQGMPGGPPPPMPGMFGGMEGRSVSPLAGRGPGNGPYFGGPPINATVEYNFGPGGTPQLQPRSDLVQGPPSYVPGPEMPPPNVVHQPVLPQPQQQQQQLNLIGSGASAPSAPGVRFFESRAALEMPVAQPGPSASIEANSTIEVTLVKDGSRTDKFGFANVPALDSRGILISWIDGTGLLAHWNRSFPDRAVSEGDRIVFVNGVTDDVEMMREQLELEGVVMRVQRQLRGQP